MNNKQPMDELLNTVECVLHDGDHHIVKEPIRLACRHYVCKECVAECGCEIECSKCKIKSTIDLRSASVLHPTNRFIKSNIQNLIQHLKSKFDTLSLEVNGESIAVLFFNEKTF